MSFHSKIGLVLSGGGMRGMAHIGVIQAMREMEFEADIISGSSIGSLVGAMYAMDMPVSKMLDFFRNISLFSFRNYNLLKPGIISPLRFKSKLEEIFPHDNFKELKKELYISVTNLNTGKARIVENGSLIHSILCSSAVPGIFSPVLVNGEYYADGGITNNFPIEPLVARCECIIGSYVNPLIDTDYTYFRNAYSVIDRAFHIAMYNMEADNFHKSDIFIMPDGLKHVPQFSLKYIDHCFDLGYQEAKKNINTFIASQSNFNS